MPDTFRQKLIRRIATDPGVAPILALATKAADLHRRMMDAHQYDLDPEEGIKRLKVLLIPPGDGPVEQAKLQVVIDKIHDLSNKVVAESLRDAARKNCQATMDTLTDFIFKLLPVAVSAAERAAAEVQAQEERFLAGGYGLPHSPLPPLVIAQSIVALFEDQLRAITHAKENVPLPLNGAAFSYTIGLFNP